MPYYAVQKGHSPGVYTSWPEVQKQIAGFNRPVFRKFETREEAESFVQGVNQVPKTKQSSIADFFPTTEPQETANSLICFTDGACTANGKRNARASYAVVWPEHPELDSAHVLSDDQLHTNNRGEYTALIYAMDQADTLDPTSSKTLIVYTDSLLMVRSLTEWMPSWKRNGWKKSDGEQVQNLDLLQTLDAKTQHRKTVFRHVKAHTKNTDWESRYNDKVDRLARGALVSP